MKCEALFDRLGTAIREEWALGNFDERRLPAIAERHLLEARLSSAVSGEEIAEYALRSRHRVVTEADKNFGQPNINLYVDQRFFIEALFWLEGTTAIHEHAFSGAFEVLQGGSVHSRFAFAETERLNDGFRLGRLEQTQIELLTRGDVRQITSGDGFIHSLFHLEHPSVSIVVRTNGDPDAGVQFAYLSPSVKYNPFARTQFQKLAARTLEMLRKSRSPAYEAQLVAYLRACEVREAVEVLANEALFADEAWLTRVVGQLDHTPYAPALPQITASLLDTVRMTQIKVLRSKVTDRELRLTLGILMNCRDRHSLFALLSRAFPQVEPEAKLVESLHSLARVGIGFPEGDSSIDFVAPLLAGLTDEQLVESLKQSYGVEEVEQERGEILEACRLLRRHPLLVSILCSG